MVPEIGVELCSKVAFEDEGLIKDVDGGEDSIANRRLGVRDVGAMDSDEVNEVTFS